MTDRTKDSTPVRTRYAPSPTGFPHIGNYRTALFEWLAARHTGGKFVLRVEDTDRKRLVTGSIEAIQEGLKWLGLEWDEGPDVGGPYGPYTQSERLDLYGEYGEKLIEQGDAYRCYCTEERLGADARGAGGTQTADALRPPLSLSDAGGARRQRGRGATIGGSLRRAD